VAVDRWGRWVAVALVVVCLATVVGLRVAHGGPFQEPPRTCSAYRLAVDAVEGRPVDQVALDPAAIAKVLRRSIHSYRVLSGTTASGQDVFQRHADLLERAAAAVQRRWGRRDGVELHLLAFRSRRFSFLTEALAEDGDVKAANDLEVTTSDAGAALWRVAHECDHIADIAYGSTSQLPAAVRGFLPVTAVDLEQRALVHVDDHGVSPTGPSGRQFAFPVPIRDRSGFAARSGERPGAGQRPGMFGVDGAPRELVDSEAECVAEGLDGSLVTGAFSDDVLRFTGQASSDVPSDVAAAGCPVQGPADDEIVITVGRRDRDLSSIVVASHGTVRRKITVDGCNIVSPAVVPHSATILFAAGCKRSVDNGIWSADASSGPHHLLTCRCAVPQPSPDGSWFAFAVSRSDAGSGIDTRVGFAAIDGSSVFALDAGPLSFPMWLTPA
jgi:hypothetical protein